MPISKIFLPDVNVWLALASQRHSHSEICTAWLNSLRSETLVFCRISQMGLLRLLTTEIVMGKEVLACRDAWRTYQTILCDERVSFAPEPFALEHEWRKLTSQAKPAAKIWTDAYLSAFARSGEMTLVTLDKAVAAIDPGALIIQ